jgi:hypothetical protein
VGGKQARLQDGPAPTPENKTVQGCDPPSDLRADSSESTSSMKMTEGATCAATANRARTCGGRQAAPCRPGFSLHLLPQPPSEGSERHAALPAAAAQAAHQALALADPLRDEGGCGNGEEDGGDVGGNGLSQHRLAGAGGAEKEDALGRGAGALRRKPGRASTGVVGVSGRCVPEGLVKGLGAMLPCSTVQAAALQQVMCLHGAPSPQCGPSPRTVKSVGFLMGHTTTSWIKSLAVCWPAMSLQSAGRVASAWGGASRWRRRLTKDATVHFSGAYTSPPAA